MVQDITSGLKTQNDKDHAFKKDESYNHPNNKMWR